MGGVGIRFAIGVCSGVGCGLFGGIGCGRG